jgi:hypothetical protein
MIDVKVYEASQLHNEEWLDLRNLAAGAYGATLNRTSEEIDQLLGGPDTYDFVASHQDPNVLVGTAVADNQEYSNARVAVATLAKQLVGYAYAADNVSGTTQLQRELKRWSIMKNYFWMREVAVKPGMHGQHIGRSVCKHLLQQGNGLQPVTANVWPKEMSFLPPLLHRLGFEEAGTQQVRLFGADSEPVNQVRMRAPSARGLLERI